MALTVLIRGDEQEEEPLALTLDAPRIVIGRSKSCEVQLPDPSVSARHAVLRLQGGQNLIVDEGSTNGITVGNVRLPPRTPRALRDGDSVRIGRLWLELHFGMGLPPQPKQSVVVARQLVERRLRAAGEPCAPVVRVAAGPGSGKQLVLEEAERSYLVGRAEECDLSVDDSAASRRHLGLERREGRVWVTEQRSKQGSTLDGTALGAAPTPWRPGKPLELCDTRLELDDPVGEALDELRNLPDERMAAAELAAPSPFAADPEPVVQAPEEGTADQGEAADGASKPTPEPPLPEAVEEIRDELVRRGFGPVDMMVVLVALAVMALSIAGLMWLLQ
jgi:pSer/pThr/pTyr-binding forkhead associated (FHA) protein